MKLRTPAWLSLGFLSLSLTAGLSVAQAAPSENPARTNLRATPERVQRIQISPRERILTLETDPSRMITMQEWSRFVRTEIPQIDKVDRGPFAVRQHRRFERGETLVPPSLHMY